MGVTLTFLRRTQDEINIFGGEVFIDIDGRNVGKLGLSDFTQQLDSGVHTIKMYKSHTFDTFIGTAETVLKIADGEHLMLKYAAPMVVSQPGSIVVSPYSQTAAENEIRRRSDAISSDYRADKERKEESARKGRNAAIIVFALIALSGILWAIYYSSIFW
jgi:hypothetical protein